MQGVRSMVLQAHVAPSILAADFAALGEGIKRCGPSPPHPLRLTRRLAPPPPRLPPPLHRTPHETLGGTTPNGGGGV